MDVIEFGLLKVSRVSGFQWETMEVVRYGPALSEFEVLDVQRSPDSLSFFFFTYSFFSLFTFSSNFKLLKKRKNGKNSILLEIYFLLQH